MFAVVHEGERITPRAFNPAAGASGNSRLEALVERLSEQFAALQESMERGNQINQSSATALNGNQRVPILVTVVTS